MSALSVAREVSPDVPFIFVSGTIGEERAINALLCGAVDYVLKSNPARLAPAVRRALDDAEKRTQREQQQAQIAAPGSRAAHAERRQLAGRSHPRSHGAAARDLPPRRHGGWLCYGHRCREDAGIVRPTAGGLEWRATSEITDALRAVVAESATRPTSIIGRVHAVRHAFRLQ